MIIRGVEIWFGLSDEEPGEGVLRPVTVLCGLTLGGLEGSDPWDFPSGDIEGELESPARIYLATSGGKRLELAEGVIDPVGLADDPAGLNGQHHRCLP